MTTTTMKRATQGTARLLLGLGFALCSGAFAGSAWAISASLTAPANNAVFTAPASITLTATATPTNANRPIAKVEFFRGGATLIGTDTTSPYSFAWTNVPAGTYSLTAKATDSTGATATSTAVSVKVNAPPTVSLTSPANNAVFSPGATIALAATAADSDGTISKVEFFQGTTLIGSDTSSPYSLNWTSVPTGSYSLTARATDSNGAVTTSAPVVITVDSPPTVSITAPANNAIFLPPANVTVSASATDADGTVAKVEFFDGTTLVGTVTAAPFSVTLANLAAGTHTLTARATDDLGLSTTSTAVTIRVDAAPTVSITAPANGAVFTAPAGVTITATATDSDGTVAKVDFFDGATLAGTATAAPYSVTLTNVSAGTHALTARATDNQGAVTTSAAVSIIVNTPPTVSITAPAANAVFTAPANVTITATATDSDGTVAKVDFYAGAALIGTANTAPYTFIWANVAAGSYSLTAVATDNLGASTTSAAVPIAVNAQTTLSASPTSVAVGGTVTATWSGIAAPSTGNFLGLYAPGSNTQLSYLFLNGAASGSLPFTLPDSMAQGTYELRLFAPNSALLAISNSFTAGPPVTVSGTVSASGAVLAGVTFAASNGGTCTTSNASGQYSCTVLQGWSGSVTPSFSGFSLTPASRDYTGVAANVSAQDYTASSTTQLSASPTAVAVGGTLTASWSGIAAPSTGNFLGLYAPGSNTQLSYLFLNGAASGSLPFTLPTMAQGTYQLRLFAPNSALLAISNSFTVGPPVTVSGTVTAGGAVLAGVTFAASNGGTCTTSNASGQYSCTVLQGWSGTVTPSLSGYSFVPSSLSYSGVSANLTAQNYAAAYQVSGTVTASGTAVAGVSFTATNGGTCTASDASGQYSCTVLQGWSGTVTPSLAGYTFVPASRDYSGVTAHQTAQNYAANPPPVLSGTVTSSGSPLAGVNFAATNGGACTSSNASGQYSCTVPQGWSGNVTPSLSGYDFNPVLRNYLNATVNQIAQDYAATPIYQLSGTVTAGGSPLAGVAFAATNGGACTASNASGQYSCSVLQGWSGSVTASLGGYTFTPPSRGYSAVAANQTAQDYAAAPAFRLSGTVAAGGTPTIGVAFTATNGGTCTSSNASGQYSCNVPQGWSGSVRPSLSGYSFTPASRAYSNVTNDQAAQDFAAMNVGATTVFYIHPDHLNTPRMIADQAGNTVWRWDNQEPFGSDLPNDDPGNTGNPFVFDLRFPGQYFDRETGLAYNVFRDYDAGIGRYTEADPAGSVLFRDMAFNNLGGLGLLQPELASLLYSRRPQYNHLYGFVNGNPIAKRDPMGLVVACDDFTGQCYNSDIPDDPNNQARANCIFRCNVKYQWICSGIALAGSTRSPVLGAATGLTCILIKNSICNSSCNPPSSCEGNQ